MYNDFTLVLFDIDGTVVDSDGHIFRATELAFEALGLEVPTRLMVREGVGLSVDESMARLAPMLEQDELDTLAQRYKDEFVRLRREAHPDSVSPLFPKAAETLKAMAAVDTWFLGTATGKSMRGLQHVIDTYALEGVFTTLQCADNNPSKPNPAMVLAGIGAVGVSASRCVMVGDTVYDMQAAKLAGAKSIGVTWGYHSVAALKNAGADLIVSDFADIPDAVRRLVEVTL